MLGNLLCTSNEINDVRLILVNLLETDMHMSAQTTNIFHRKAPNTQSLKGKICFFPPKLVLGLLQ